MPLANVSDDLRIPMFLTPGPSLQVQVNEYVEAMNAYVEEYRQNMFRNSAILLPLSTEEGVAQNAADTDITSE